MRPSPTVEVPVVVVVPPRLLMLDVAGPVEVLRGANLAQDRLCFAVSFVAPAAVGRTSIGLGVAGLGRLPDRLPDGAIVLVPGSADAPLGDPPDRPEEGQEQAIVAWLARVVRPGIRLVSICSGALLVARAGLLDGYECTTHHACLAELAAVAPKARVKGNRLFCEDRERLTSAGITAGLDLMLHVVAGLAGHATALAVARYLVVYIRRGGADPQLSPWLEGRNHLHPAVHRAQDAGAADPARDWSVAALARVAATSPRSLSRLFNAQAGMSVTDFVNRMRVALAREVLAGSRLDMEAVAERAGFASARQLRRAWSRLSDLPPSRSRPPAVDPPVVL